MKQKLHIAIRSWRDILQIARQEHPESVNVYTYAKTIARLANASRLGKNDIIELALHLGIKVFPRDRTFHNYLGSSKRIVTGLPDNWVPLLNETYFSLAYHNPEEFLEYIAVVPSRSGSLPYIIHHTPEGYINPNWFNEVVPLLYQISCEANPKNHVGKTFKHQQLTLGQVNTINHFFKSDPILKIEGLCTNCYRVSLPKKGFGVRFHYEGQPKDMPPYGMIKEIRFSARKSSSMGPTSKPYVTELIIASPGMNVETIENTSRPAKRNEPIWTMIDSKTGRYGFSTYPERKETHIDAALYDFDKLSMRLPVCSCTQ